MALNHLETENHEEEEVWASFQQSKRSFFETAPIASFGHHKLKMCVGLNIRSLVCIQERKWQELFAFVSNSILEMA